MPSAAVTDTHALVWYAAGHSRKLGGVARRLFKSADDGKAIIYIPALVLVEVLELIARGQLRAAPLAEQWVNELFAGGRFVYADLTREIALAAYRLQSIPERGDRLIAATAAQLDLPVITRDPAIASAAGVASIW